MATVKCRLYGAAGGSPIAEVSRGILGNSSRYDTIAYTPGGSQASGGYVELEVTSGTGIVAFEMAQLTARATVIGLHGLTVPDRTTLYSAQLANSLGMFTGLAFYNPSPVTAKVTVRVYSEEGALVGQNRVDIGPHCRISRVVPELVPSFAGQVKGSIVVESTRPVVAQQLFGDQNLTCLCAVPPTVVD